MDPATQFLLTSIQQEIRDLRKEMKQNHSENQSEIKELQGFKWKTAGIATTCSFIIGVVLKIYFH